MCIRDSRNHGGSRSFPFHKGNDGGPHCLGGVCLCAGALSLIHISYFLVILPLPDVETVSGLTSARVQLIPFREVADLLRNANVDPCQPATWYRLVWNRDFFQIAANVAMFVPLGIYPVSYTHLK